MEILKQKNKNPQTKTTVRPLYIEIANKIKKMQKNKIKKIIFHFEICCEL